jgi:hypothetical protein
MHLNSEEIEAFLRGKPVSDEFIDQLKNRTKALIEKVEVITKDLSRPGDDLLPTTAVKRPIDKDYTHDDTKNQLCRRSRYQT